MGGAAAPRREGSAQWIELAGQGWGPEVPLIVPPRDYYY